MYTCSLYVNKHYKDNNDCINHLLGLIFVCVCVCVCVHSVIVFYVLTLLHDGAK